MGQPAASSSNPKHRTTAVTRRRVVLLALLALLVAGGVEAYRAWQVVSDVRQLDDRRVRLDQVATEDGLDRIGLEPSLPGNGLGVVVTVDQHRARGPGNPAFAEHGRVAAGLQDAPIETARPQRGGQPFAGDAHFLRRLADRLEPKELDEALDDRPAAGGERAIEDRPVRAHGARVYHAFPHQPRTTDIC